MASRLATSSLRRAAGFLTLLLALAAGTLVGCSTPQERYKVLSFFFDGVPDPNKPKDVRVVNRGESEQAVVTKFVIMSRHKPFVEGKCASCHNSDTGDIMEFEDAYKRCVRCHKTISTEYPLMHGPVAREGCQWCHTGHESAQPALLKDEPIKVCTQCHDQQLLGNKPQEHIDGKTSCILCHAGHGGSQRYFFKPVPQTPPADWPSSGKPSDTQPAAPVTQPASQPTTLPATEPARPPPLHLQGQGGDV